MEEIQEILKLIQPICDNKIIEINVIHGIINQIKTKLEELDPATPTKKKKIKKILNQKSDNEIDAEIDRFSKMVSLRSIIKKSISPSSIDLKMIDIYYSDKKEEYLQHRNPFSAVLYEFVKSHDEYLSLTDRDFIESILQDGDDVQIKREKDCFVLFNATKGIALAVKYWEDVGSSQDILVWRQRFFQKGSIQESLNLTFCIDGTVDNLSSFFDKTLDKDQLCVVEKKMYAGFTLCIEPFLKNEIWYKEYFSFLMDLAIYGHYEIKETETGAWMFIIFSRFSIYCERGPAGELENMLLGDGSIVAEEGYETSAGDAFFEWTRNKVCATILNLHERTMAMFDGKSWFRHDNKLFDFTVDEEKNGSNQ